MAFTADPESNGNVKKILCAVTSDELGNFPKWMRLASFSLPLASLSRLLCACSYYV
jgi:hypothetical protein